MTSEKIKNGRQTQKNGRQPTKYFYFFLNEEDLQKRRRKKNEDDLKK